MKRSLMILLIWLAGFRVAGAQITVNIQSDGKVTTANDGKITLTGDWNNRATFEGNITLNGATNQAIVNTNGFFETLEVDNPTGARLDGGVLLREELLLTDGVLDNSQPLRVADSSTIVRDLGRLLHEPIFQGGVNVAYVGTQPAESGPELPSANVYTLTVDNPGGVTLTTDVIVQGTLDLQSGNLNNAGHDVTLDLGATVEVGEGDITNPPLLPDSINVIYDGTTPATTGFELNASINNMIIDNPANVTLAKSITIRDSLIFKQGMFLTRDNVVTLGEKGVLTGEGESRYVVGSITTTRTVDWQANDFGGIGPILSRGPKRLEKTTVTRVTGPAAVETIYGDAGIQRRWTLQPETDNGGKRSLTFAWLSLDDNGVDLTEAQIWRRSASGWLPFGMVADSDSVRSLTADATALSGVWTVKSYALSGFAGDVDGSYVRDNVDVDLVVRHILYGAGLSAWQFPVADLNGDRIINLSDLVQLVDLIAAGPREKSDDLIEIE